MKLTPVANAVRTYIYVLRQEARARQLARQQLWEGTRTWLKDGGE